MQKKHLFFIGKTLTGALIGTLVSMALGLAFAHTGHPVPMTHPELGAGIGAATVAASPDALTVAGYAGAYLILKKLLIIGIYFMVLAICAAILLSILAALLAPVGL